MPVRSSHQAWTLAPWAGRRPRVPRARDGVAPLLPASAPVQWWGPAQGPHGADRAARDLLWAALGDVVSSSVPRAVVLRGTEERSLSALTGWIRLRAAELGAAAGLRAVLGPDAWEGDPVEPLLRGAEPGADPRLEDRRAASPRPEERYAQVHAALSRRGRPWVLCLDEAQHSAEVPRLVSWLLAAQPLPLLLVVGVVESELEPGLARELAALEARPGVWCLSLEPVEEPLPPPPDLPAAEVVAAQGRVVDRALWRRACADLGLDAGPAVEAALIEAGLFEPVPGGWLFRTAAHRGQLLERAWREGRWERVHEALARRLAQAGLPGRQGVHLARAGQVEGALQPLLEGARQARQRGDLLAVEALVAEREAALRLLGVPSTDTSWGEGWLLSAQVARQRGRLTEATERVSRAMGVAAGVGDLSLRARGLKLLAGLALERSDLSGAMGLATRAADLFAELRDPVGMAGTLLDLGHAARRRGRSDLAHAAFERASDLLEGAGEEALLAESLLARGLADLTLGRTEAAEASLVRALTLFERHHMPAGQAEAHNELGVVAAWRDHLDEAEQCFRRAASLYEEAGHVDVYVSRLNLGLVLVEQGRGTEAAVLLRSSLDPVRLQGRKDLAGAIHVGLLSDAAARQDWEDWDHHFWQARRRLAETSFADVGVARAAALAARLAEEAGEEERARDASALAEGQRAVLGGS